MEEKDLIVLTPEIIQSRIYAIRGQRVMLDVDLAEIYGYETKNFNRQVKNNLQKFEGDDFMFRLSHEEQEELSRCKNFTLNKGSGRGSNIKYAPYAFTEQGIYMLMTVLKGELAVRQSRALIRLFKQMKVLYHCGASSKDAGTKITTITQIGNTGLYHPMFDELMKQANLAL